MVKLLSERFCTVRISVTGLNLQRLLNLFSENGITLGNIVRTDYTAVEADASAADFKKLLSLVPPGYSVKTVSHKGLLFKCTALFKRPALLLGLVIAVTALTVLSGRTLFIRVYGCKDTASVRKTLAECGMLDWAFRLPAKYDNAIEAVKASDDKILWAALERRGCTLCAYIKTDERVVPESTSGTEIVASKAGVVRRVTVLEGTPAVTEGETVAEGQTLIEGSVTFGEAVYPVSPEGTVIASVWYYAGDDIVIENGLEPTGNTRTVREADIFGLKITFGGKNEFAEYTVTQNEVYSGSLPFKITDTVYSEQARTKPFDREGTIEETKKGLTESLMLSVPEDAQVISVKTETDESDGIIRVGVYLETAENIALLT